MTSKELSKWSDGFMYKAEESFAADGPSAHLLGGPTDPLGQIAASAKMYKGEVVRDLRDVTDAERREYLEQIQKTVLKMPLESVQLHFMVEGVTRSFTHQMVRQRTAAYAQESMRFAVKEDAATAVALPPSLSETKTLDELVKNDLLMREFSGLANNPTDGDWADDHRIGVYREAVAKGGPQAWRLKWDEALKLNSDVYLELVNDGMPAEDARGMTWHNITTRLNYITNLRSWYDTMAVRVSDQAQFEWRAVAMHMAMALRNFGERNTYLVWIEDGEDLRPGDNIGAAGTGLDHRMNINTGKEEILVRRSSYWQYEALSNELKPIEFKIGGPAFGANFDRPSRIGERVREFHKYGVPSDQWTTGSIEHGIPPIHPNEWLLDPNSARLAEGEEFDAFGNRVPKGTGWHFSDHGVLARPTGDRTMPFQAGRWPRDFPNGQFTMDNKPGAEEPTDQSWLLDQDEDGS